MERKSEADRFVTITELTGDQAPLEQIDRLIERYHWAAEYSKGKDVVELACGSGPGIGVLSQVSNSFVAGDISQALVDRCKKNYGENIDIRLIDVENLQFEPKTLDVIILFEALYYLGKQEEFFKKTFELLRSGGKLLIATANKDLSDFNPSPFSTRYLGVTELTALCKDVGFEYRFFGGTPISTVGYRQKFLRPIKRVAVQYNLIPKTMSGKKLLKKLVFGGLYPIPSKIEKGGTHFGKLTLLNPDVKDTKHKVIYLEATKPNE